jgi:hypothetical protein
MGTEKNILTVFSQYKILLDLEKKYIHTGQTEMLCLHLGNAYSIL